MKETKKLTKVFKLEDSSTLKKIIAMTLVFLQVIVLINFDITYSQASAANLISPINVTGHSNPNFPPENAIDGNVNTRWESAPATPWAQAQDDHRRFIDIHLGGLYNLDSVKIINPSDGTVFYHYQVYASPNGDAFTKIAFKSNNMPATPEGITHNVAESIGASGVSIIRIQVSFASARFPVSISEVELRGTRSSDSIPERATFEIPKFEETEWAVRHERFENDPAYARERIILEMKSLVGRVLGEQWVDSFIFEVRDVMNNGLDAFELEYTNGRVVIRGRNGVSIASGLNHYLKNFAHVNFNPMFVSNVQMPDILPSFDGRIVRRTNFEERYALNFCTFSYTMAFWGWPEFEAYLDYAAMNGINLMLQIVGQEEVLVRFLENFGYSVDDVLEYITGPGYFAWFYMQNMTGWGGPLPRNWLYQRVELGRQMHDRMQAFGIRPVLQGFSGMVPTDFRQRLNEYRDVSEGDPGYWPQFSSPSDQRNSIAPQGQWIGFQRPDMIRTTSTSGNFFQETAELFYAAQKEVFGNVSNYYSVDPFHEGGNIQGMNRTEVYRIISEEMIRSDPNAIWVIQQWIGTVNDATLQGMDRNHVLVLDLNAEMRPEHGPMERTGTNWIWNMLHNFGGRMGIFGDLPVLANDIPTTFAARNHMVGIGVTTEAYANSPIVYDLLHDMTWRDRPINHFVFVRDYIHSRYGDFNGAPEANALIGWNIIADTALARKTTYVQGPPESVINARPTATFTSASTWGHSRYEYDPIELEQALPFFIAAYDNLGETETFHFDFVELTAQVLSTATLEIHGRMMNAFNRGDVDQFFFLSEKFLDAIRLMDEVLSVSPRFGVGHWIYYARNMLPEMDDWTRDLFEFNARTLITTWGGMKNSSLVDYSNRQWAGLTSGLYLPRWERFVNAHRAAILPGGSLSLPSASSFFLQEWEWANRKSDETGYYSTVGVGNLQELAQRVWDEFSLTNMDGAAAETRSNIALGRPVQVNVPGRTEMVTTGLTDGNLGTEWQAATPDEWPVIMTINLESPSKITAVAFAVEQAGSHAIDYTIEAFLADESVASLTYDSEGAGFTGTREEPMEVVADSIRFTFNRNEVMGEFYTALFVELMIFGVRQEGGSRLLSGGRQATIATGPAGLASMDTIITALNAANFSVSGGAGTNLTNGDLDGTPWGPQGNYPVAFRVDLGNIYYVEEVRTAFERLEHGNTNPNVVNPDPDNLPLKSYRFAIFVRDNEDNLHIVLDQTNHTGNLDSRFFKAPVNMNISAIYAVILGHNGQTGEIGAGNGWPAFTQIQAFGRDLQVGDEEPEPPEEVTPLLRHNILRTRVNTWSTSGSDAFSLNALIDGNENTYWHGRWSNAGSGLWPASEIPEPLVDFDLGEAYTISRIELDKRIMANGAGTINAVSVFTHEDVVDTWPNGERTWPSQTLPNVPQADIDADFSSQGWAQVDSSRLSAVGLSSEPMQRQTVRIDFDPPLENTRYVRLAVRSIRAGGVIDFAQVSELRVFSDVELTVAGAELSNLILNAISQVSALQVGQQAGQVPQYARDRFDAIIAEAQNDVLNPYLTSAQVNAWRARLNAAIRELRTEIIEIDNGALLVALADYSLVNKLNSLNFVALEELYSEPYAQALAVANNLNATQQQIDEAVVMLRQTMENSSPVFAAINRFLPVLTEAIRLRNTASDDISPEALDALNAAISLADDASKVAMTANEIDEITANLAKAIEAFNKFTPEDPDKPELFAGSNPNVLRDLLAQQDVVLQTAGNLGIFAHHSPFVIPAGRTLTIATTLNVQGNAELIIEGTLVVQEGGRVNNQGGTGGTIRIKYGGVLENHGHVENVTNSTIINYGTIENNHRFEVRAGTRFHSCYGEIIGTLNIHRNAITCNNG